MNIKTISYTAVIIAASLSSITSITTAANAKITWYETTQDEIIGTILHCIDGSEIEDGEIKLKCTR